MKVEAVSNLGFRSNNFSFGEKQGVHENVPAESSNRASDFAKVPVIVLLAMNPATLNSKIPTMPETDNPNKVVMLAPETKSAEKSTYVIAPEVQQTRPKYAPYGWTHLRHGKIQYVENIKVNNYKDMDLVFFTPESEKKINNEVSEIFIIMKNQKGCKNIIPHPPKIVKIVYHNIGKDKEYCSVLTEGYLVNDDGDAIGYAYSELKIDDDTANKILAFRLDKTEWKNETGIEFETTTSKAMSEPKIEYFKD